MRKFMFLSVSSSLLLSGCFFVAGAAAGAAAIAVVYDHRKFEQILTDQQINKTIYDEIEQDPALKKDSHISVSTFNQVVLLAGETPKPENREKIERIANSIEGVKKVYNQLTIQGPTSSLTRTSDTWITTKIKSEMLSMKDLKSSNIKVVTENGTVYLMGEVSRDQAETSVEIARSVSGVQKVVKIFQYVD